MKSMKKLMIYAILFCLLLALGGCKKDREEDTASVETEQSQVEATESIQESSVVEENEKVELNKLSELLSIIKDSNWSGVDSEGNAYVVSIKDEQLVYSIKGKDETAQYEGDFSLDEFGKLIVENDELNQKLKNAEFKLVLDGENTCLQIGDLLLTKESLSDYKQQLDKLDIAAVAAEYLNSGHCWLACFENQVVLIFFDGQEISMKYVYNKDGEIITEDIDANWSMNAELFAFYDFSGKRVEDFEWSFEEEGDLKVFIVNDKDNNEMTFYELEKESINEGEELAKSYLENQKTADEVEDLTQVLKGYEGVSIVDAFVAAGLDPSLSNRAIFAEKFEIENYRGTAEQNLFLLESMGGTIK